METGEVQPLPTFDPGVGVIVCPCGKLATCYGEYEGGTVDSYACDDCCGHGNEDGAREEGDGMSGKHKGSY